MMRKITLSLAAAASLMAFGGVAQAVPAVVAVQVAPPAPIVETMPAPRDGYAWAPGHYAWRNGNYVWVSGHWMNDRPGQVWREAHWQQRRDGSWVMVEGHWAPRAQYGYGYGRDRDHDGVVNRYDRDRDGDGVANWNDSHPNNPYRN